MQDDKELIKEMKAFFKVNSLEDIAERLGYSRNSANNWRNNGLNSRVISKFEKAKADKKKDDEAFDELFFGGGIGGILVRYDREDNTQHNYTLSPELVDFILLYINYGNKALLDKFTQDLKQIQNLIK
ncbi:MULTISPECIES: hypothetical protein [Campylobacter]|uniref:Uncharacterized protein n=1 Tax=Campylobacter porcelli TaxID=1660073 RepID=A0A1X9SVS4_9BACT|nr:MULTISPECIES: hypothetical protein [Campylobacter]ARR00367.1 hypothetical protein CSUIS_0540 [Campylobacter sp. RM6137]